MALVSRATESVAVAVARRRVVRDDSPQPQIECPFCKGVYPDLSWHYAVGPNTCPELARAWDEKPKVDPQTLPCHRCGEFPRMKNKSYCQSCCRSDAELARIKRKKK